MTVSAAPTTCRIAVIPGDGIGREVCPSSRTSAADRIDAAVAAVIAAGELTPDLGGPLTTTQVGERLVARVEAARV